MLKTDSKKGSEKKSPYLAIGNGEKCPFCDTILDSREGYDGEDIQKHLFEKHEKEVVARLFPNAK